MFYLKYDCADTLWIPIIDLYMHIHTGKRDVAGNDALCKYHGYMDQKIPSFTWTETVIKFSSRLFIVKIQTKKTYYAKG